MFKQGFFLLSVSSVIIFPMPGKTADTNVVPVIRVTARQFSDRTTAVPADITVINRQTIEQSGASSVPELLKKEANMLIRGFRGKSSLGQPSMRGFGDNSGLRVLVLIDGQSMNPEDMAAIDWQQISLNRIRSIEVIRGGQTVLYGSHALSGVIKITTEKGGPPLTRIKTAVGSDGFGQYNVLHSGSLSNWFYSVSANYDRDEGFRENSLTHSRSAQATLGRFFGETGTLTLKSSLGSSYIQTPGPFSAYEEMLDDPTKSTNEGDQYLETDHQLHTFLWESDHLWGSLQIGGGLKKNESKWDLSGIYADNNQSGYHFNPRVRLGDESSFILSGLDLRYDTLDFNRYLTEDRQYTASWAKLSRITAGPYLSIQKETVSKLFLNGGLRYEISRTDYKNVQYNEDQLRPTIPSLHGGTIPNPDYKNPPDIMTDQSYDEIITKRGFAADLSLNWNPVDPFSLWAGYDRLYHYPALDEVASYQGYTTIPLPVNPDLEPETGDQFETGIKYCKDEWEASATLFYMLLYGEIGWDDSATQNINIGDTKRTGADLNLSYTTDEWGCSTSWEFVHAEFADGANKGNEVPLVPLAHGTTSVWIKPIDRLRLSFSHTYVSEQPQGNDFPNSVENMKSYSLFGFKADCRITKPLSIYLKINNLTDKTYAEMVYLGGYYPGPGRYVETGLTLEF